VLIAISTHLARADLLNSAHHDLVSLYKVVVGQYRYGLAQPTLTFDDRRMSARVFECARRQRPHLS